MQKIYCYSRIASLWGMCLTLGTTGVNPSEWADITSGYTEFCEERLRNSSSRSVSGSVFPDQLGVCWECMMSMTMYVGFLSMFFRHMANFS